MHMCMYIHIYIYIYTYIYTYHLQVIAGLRLPKADVFGLSDPFVVLTIGKQRVATHVEFSKVSLLLNFSCKTSVVLTFENFCQVEMCTLNPEWGDEFEFQLMGDSELLKLEVFDWDVDANDFLGCTEVNIWVCICVYVCVCVCMCLCVCVRACELVLSGKLTPMTFWAVRR